MVWTPKTDPHKDTNDYIEEMISAHKLDFIAIGYHGRKGPKEDPSIFGSSVYNMSLNAMCPILIIKNEVDRKKKPSFNWLICTDGSEYSLKGFE